MDCSSRGLESYFSASMLGSSQSPVTLSPGKPTLSSLQGSHMYPQTQAHRHTLELKKIIYKQQQNVTLKP